MKRILVIRFSSLGDLILVTPFFREAQAVFGSEPKSLKIDFLTSTDFAPLFENNPHIDRVIALDRKGGGAELDRVVALLGSEQYEHIFDLHRSLRSRAFLLRMKGAKYLTDSCIHRINKRSVKRALLIHFKINRFNIEKPQREAFLDTLRPFAQHTIKSQTELFPDSATRLKIDSILQQKGELEKPLVALGTSASFDLKCWPKEYFLELCDRLGEDYRVVLLGGKGEATPDLIEQEARTSPLNLAGKLNFLETAEMLKRCALAVSNDSAVVHFAEAMETPVLALFGPTTKQFGFAPFLPLSQLVEREMNCRPCSRNGRGNCKIEDTKACLTHITVDRVYNLTINHLKAQGL